MAAPVAGTAVGHAGNPTTSATATLGTTAANTILIAVAVNGGAWSSIGAGAGTAQWGGVWWSRCTGNHSTQTVIAATATDSCSLIVIPVTGCLTGASPVDTNVSSANVTANGLGLAAFNTTVVDTLVMLGIAADDNIAITSPTKGGSAMAISTAASTGGADSIVGIANVSQAAAGTTGAFAGTHASALSKRLVGFALKPPAAATVERSAAVDATAAIAVSGTFFTIFQAAAAVAATGSIASSGEFETPATTFERSASVSATGAATVAGFRRDVHRQAAVSATGAIVTAGRRDLLRSAAVTATGAVASDGHAILERSTAVSASGAVSSTGQRALLRAVQVAATGNIFTSGQIEGQTTEHNRSAALTATASIDTTAVFWTTFERTVALTATATTSTAGLTVRERSASLEATGAISTTGSLALARAVALSAVAAISVTVESQEWTYGPVAGWSYLGGTAAVYAGGTAFNYGPGAGWTYHGGD
jgi:hypothetical protein